MVIEVPESLLAKTRCAHDFACLDEGGCPGCELVEIRAGGEALFVDGKGGPCEHAVPFGGGTVCTCPVHQELVKRGYRRPSRQIRL